MYSNDSKQRKIIKRLVKKLGGQTNLAKLLNMTQPGFSRWLECCIPAERCADFIKIYNEYFPEEPVTLQDLRPDLFE